MSVILFEDELVAQLSPVAIGSPAFCTSCGSYRLLDLIVRLDEAWEAIVRPHLREVLAADFPHLAGAAGTAEDPVMLVNARLVPKVSVLKRLREFFRRGRPAVVRLGESVAAAILPPGVKPPGWDTDMRRIVECFAGLPHEDAAMELPLFEYPHDVIRHHMAALPENLEDRLTLWHYQEIADGVFAGPGATLGQYVVTDSGGGPILLDENARVGPYTYLSGPTYIGAGTRIIEHSALKDNVALGHTCKVGGEVEASAIEPYTNKQHHGFLGHSYLGSWINLGAGTSNSDLKNTYGTVSMEYDGRKVDTEMQFVGCIMGDYAKTAVNTSIFTGKTIGACSMVYGFVTTNVPSFVNYARSFGQITEVPDEVIIASQARMFKRRNVTQRPCDIQLLRDIHVLTRHERQIANEPLAL
jgi:glucose-1-phosphate thymidylyltransferase